MKTEKKKLKTYRLTIYLDKKDKKQLNELKEKYHLSYSTIARIITSWMYTAMGESLEQEYIYGKDGMYKTSIRPSSNKGNIAPAKKPSLAYTNSIKIFLKKDIKKYLNEKKTEKLLNGIYRDLQNEYDENWNGNSYTRSFVRFVKQNKNYVKKLMEEN